MTIEPVFQAPPALRRIKVTAEPLSVYACLYGDDPYSFLYESLEGNQSRGRYSFVGGRPRLVFRSKGERIDLQYGKRRRALTHNPIEVLRQLVGPPTDVPAVAPFVGGAVGYLGYDVVRFFETIPDNNRDDLKLPDSLFVFPEEVIVFDHLTGDVNLLVYSDSHVSERLNRMEHTLFEHACTGEQDFTGQFGCGPPHETVPMVSRTTEAGYMAAVNRAREYIHAGDVFQVVISRRFDFTVSGDPLELYKALRCTNPSPYMYFLNFAGVRVLGSSPEILAKLEGRRVITRPLAGTRPRGRTLDEDRLHGRELLSDEKERAEHIMLVDLARNDLGRVCSFGTVRTTELLQIERYSHVLHIVSHVEGALADNCDAFDLLQATFPAGTVSGAPKVRAMEIIDELETARRGVYAGAIGYFSLCGDMDMCIAIRTIVVHGRRGFIQAGAGIVADSVARRELEETLVKAKGLMKAVRTAKGAA